MVTDAACQLCGLVHDLACRIVCAQAHEIRCAKKLIGREIAHVFIVLVFRGLTKTRLRMTVLTRGVVDAAVAGASTGYGHRRPPGGRGERLLQIRDGKFEEFLILGRAANFWSTNA